MTHTLHRRGSLESLSGDYVMLMLQAVGYNDENSTPKLQEYLRIALKHHPVNIGSSTMGGLPLERAPEVIANAKGGAHAVFNNQDDLTAMLKDLKKADLGLSVIISGVFEKVDECLKNAGMQHHTANFSLGIWGKTEKLPSNDVLEVTTMCGHSMISPNLVKAMVKEVKAGTRTPQDAAKLLAPNCDCGAFNPDRAAKLLKKMAEK